MKRRFKNEEGQALVEFALVLPILILIVCGIIDFGWLFYNQLCVENACREGARLAIVSSTVADPEGSVKEKVKENLPGNLKEDEANLDVKVDYNVPQDGEVQVRTSAKMKFLTPVMGTFFENSEREMSSTIIMKIES